jgi:hypothetical protein
LKTRETGLQVQVLNEDALYSNEMRMEWTDLLYRSNSNALFMSWEWMTTWWSIFSDSSMQLKVVVIFGKDDELLAIAPMYLSEVYIKSFLKIGRLQLIGGCWHGKETMRTEFMEFIVDEQQGAQLVRELWRYIENSILWDECVFKDVSISSGTYKHIESLVKSKGYRYKCSNEYKNYFLPLDSSFKLYLDSLGAGSRKRIFNRRKILEGFENIVFKVDANPSIELAFNELDRLHRLRWSKAVFSKDMLMFNKRFSEISGNGCKVEFSYILHNEKAISIQYNYVLNKYKYNIQAGFDPFYNKKISLGYLHFGYEIEYSYENSIERYYFLVGEGQNSNYKEHLTKSGVGIVDFIVVRSNFLKVLYWINNYKHRLLNRAGNHLL